MSKKSDKNVQTKKQGELLSLHIYKNNMDVLNFLRVVTSVLSGSVTGVLGITGWSGFLMYFLFHILVAIPIAFKTNFNVKKYFAKWIIPWTAMILTSTGMLSFLLFWIIFYNLSHVF